MARLTYRLGKPNMKDRSVFMALWAQFLEEHYQAGSRVPPTAGNLQEFLRIYDSYTGGALFGLAVIGETDGVPAGVLLGGEDPPTWNIYMEGPGRIAQLWGIYVHPDHRRKGLGWGLQDFALQEGLRMGFRQVRSVVLEGYTLGEMNALSWGARRTAFVIEHNLAEDPHGKRTSGET